jgi:hypothetical protein
LGLARSLLYRRHTQHRRLLQASLLPHPACKSRTTPQAWRYKKKGFYERDARPRRIQRYVCQHCHRNFSSQTFATDYWLRRGDLLLRHSSANHKRETIAFSKRRQAALYRVAIWTVWRNYIKDRSENRRIGPPALALGLIERAMTVSEVLAKRLFPNEVGISGWVARCYFGRIATRAIERCRSHRAVYAI